MDKQLSIRKNRLVDFFDNNINYFDDFLPELFGSIKDTFSEIREYPKVNLKDLGDSYELKIEVAGFDKDDVDIEYKDNVLSIKAENKKEVKDQDHKGYVLKEISNKSFSRYVKFPEAIDEEELNDACTSFENGVITLVFKKLENKKPDSVKIKF